MTPTPLQRNEKVLEAFDEKKKELYNPDQEWNIAGETDVVEFGYRVSDGDSIYTVPFWGNIKKFISSALATQRQEVLEEIEEKVEVFSKEHDFELDPHGYKNGIFDIITSLKQRP